ncbi:MAG: hypothetical protein ABIK62_06735, partial [candidate division WOR-3 bacterium]
QPLLHGSGAVPDEGPELAHHAWQVTWVTGLALAFLVLGFAGFFLGKVRAGSAVEAVDYIHHGPVLRSFYDWSEKRYFDIYEQGVRFLRWLAGIVFRFIDRLVDWLIEALARLAVAVGQGLRRAHTGLLAMYLSWLVTGLLFLLLLVGGIFK